MRGDWREWVERFKRRLKRVGAYAVQDDTERMIEGFELLAEEHEAAGELLSEEKKSQDEAVLRIFDHERKWQAADDFLRGVGGE